MRFCSTTRMSCIVHCTHTPPQPPPRGTQCVIITHDHHSRRCRRCCNAAAVAVAAPSAWCKITAKLNNVQNNNIICANQCVAVRVCVCVCEDNVRCAYSALENCSRCGLFTVSRQRVMCTHGVCVCVLCTSVVAVASCSGRSKTCSTTRRRRVVQLPRVHTQLICVYVENVVILRLPMCQVVERSTVHNAIATDDSICSYSNANSCISAIAG